MQGIPVDSIQPVDVSLIRLVGIMFLVSAFLLVLSSCAQDLPSLPHGCTEGSCYPATGNLLIGRAHNLSATSTCGLQGPTDYCIVSHLQGLEKCFQCDSRRPYHPDTSRNSHRVENVIYLADSNQERTWWQSENGEEQVTIQLNLEAEFHFTHLIMKFKTFRPAAMFIERSSDFGRTWKVYRYLAFNCTVSFPGIPTEPLKRNNDIICEQRYSEIEPSTGGEVIYKVLDPAVKVDDPYSLEIQDLLRITDLRIHFTKLHTLGDNLLDRRSQVLHKYYYAVYELVVRGSCFCYGHASECSPVAGVRADVLGMIHGRCICKHHTKGLNCEQCKDFYQELPWRPAKADDPHACRVCNCNNHASRCHFDMAVYRATGNVSGGVCEECLHNTMGRNCELCKPFYYRNPAADIRSHNACIPCDCDPVGSLEGGLCDSDTDLDYAVIGGQCRCKENVRAARCDHCKEGYYGLSVDNPQGCQACRCDPRGVVLSGAPCDSISGDCFCKRYVTGRYCDVCLTEYWGLSHDVKGCRACDCDFGGSYSNRCSMVTGQCDCRPHLTGRQCQGVQSGFFCMPLDLYRYEAEDADHRSPTDPLPGAIKRTVNGDCVEIGNQQELSAHRRRQRLASWSRRQWTRRRRQARPYVEVVQRPRLASESVTWSGEGFAQVQDGAGLLFVVTNIPHAMDFNLLLRYEPESAEDWEAIIKIHTVGLPITYRCGNLLPHGQPYRLTLHHTERYIMVSTPFCFEPNVRYEISIRFQRLLAPEWNSNMFILVDSLVLLPRYTELPGFSGFEPMSVRHREDMHRYMCLQSFLPAGVPMLAEMCAQLICSISAILHNGALPCACDPQGSLSLECEKVGGQCQCKNNVIGQRCDRCSPGYYALGPNGCSSCECSAEGSVHGVCEKTSGACLCRPGLRGRRCDQCSPGHWGFPSCRPCQCNGHADQCDPQTGTCLGCRDRTSGRHCERCAAGYYGDPALGSGQQCRPCPCPDYPGSENYHGISCHTDLSSNQIICLCDTGYTGSRCDKCAPSYYGNPEDRGGRCWPCRCNNNIDVTDPGSCHPHTGQCLKCLYNTAGVQCSECKQGYYGNPLQQDCRRCTCNIQGTVASQCDSRELCHCDRVTGQCPCRDNVIGVNCDHCTPHYWNFGKAQGCEPCACNLEHSYGQACNMFTGQCDCHSGFGGQTCSECKENYWGNPRLMCQMCDCDPIGSETLQCNRSTGRCLCRLGFTGAQCDQCSHGYRGHFPSCIRCHTCFNLWDEEISCLVEQIQGLKEMVQQMEEAGVGGRATAHLQELQEKLMEIQELIHQLPLASPGRLSLLGNLTLDIRQEMELLSQRLDGLEEDMSRLQDTHGKAEGDTKDLLEMTRNLRAILNQTTQQLEIYITSNIKELSEAVWTSYQESQEAEQAVNRTVWAADSPVQGSEGMRMQTERLLQQRESTFRKTMAAERKRLKELGKEVEEMTVDHINEKVCGSSAGRNCSLDPCGGANCQKCGGQGCAGVLSEASLTLRTATNISNTLMQQENQLSTIAQEIEDAQSQAKEAKSQASETLAKAVAAKQLVNSTVNDLRNFIRSVKDFLNVEGADPESIELVANLVLNISLPVTALDIQRIVQSIRDTMGHIEDLDTILNNSRRDLQVALNLSKQAEKVKKKALKIQEKVRQAAANISTLKSKVDQTEELVKAAVNSTSTLENSVEKLKDLLPGIEAQLLEAAERLSNLSTEAQALQNKTASNREAAQKAERETKDAQNRTQQLEARELQEVQRRYQELKDKVELLASGRTGGDNRVRRIQEEAEKLRQRADKSLARLNAVQKKLDRNEQAMVQKMELLQGLESNVTELLERIRERSQFYGSCT
ncbi:laminin subunit beta-2 isoform X2 [Narcine bancroftii]|uniref:laminin subunit beta-2 isoform X2 n=1 Tax=Narcine bancroftii TaxID=1343680 RepID=UPI003831E404